MCLCQIWEAEVGGAGFCEGRGRDGGRVDPDSQAAGRAQQPAQPDARHAAAHVQGETAEPMPQISPRFVASLEEPGFCDDCKCDQCRKVPRKKFAPRESFCLCSSVQSSVLRLVDCCAHVLFAANRGCVRRERDAVRGSALSAALLLPGAAEHQHQGACAARRGGDVRSTLTKGTFHTKTSHVFCLSV